MWMRTVALWLLLTGSALAQVELVETAPSETDLADKALRRTHVAWVEMIAEARQRIDIAQFYCSAKPGGGGRLEPVLAALRGAARRGVKVRLLVSDRLLESYRGTVMQIAGLPGAELRVLALGERTGGIIHAKYWLIDGRRFYIGSANCDWRALEHIHELGVVSADRGVADALGRVFAYDWALAGREDLPPARPVARRAELPRPALELVASPPRLAPEGVRDTLEALLELIDGSQRRCWVQLLSYSTGRPDKPQWLVLDRALRAAGKRGVDVRLLVSHWNVNKRGGHAQLRSLDAAPGVQVRVAEVPTHSSGEIPFARVIHAKQMIVDDGVLWVGTSNWSEKYFTVTRGVELIVREAAANRAGARVHERLWSHAITRSIAKIPAPAPRPRR